MAAEFPDHPFWDFSLEVYGREGVPAACLVLQDRYEIDVNLTLFCCWLGASGRGALSAQDIAVIRESVGSWHREVVRPVRAVRQRLKGGFEPAPAALSEPLRRRLAKIEVDLEHVEQLMLAASIEREPADSRLSEDRLHDAIDNVRAYFVAFGLAPDRADAEQLAVILGAAFASVSRAAVEDASAARLVH